MALKKPFPADQDVGANEMSRELIEDHRAPQGCFSLAFPRR